jgi:hypothetical protein
MENIDTSVAERRFVLLNTETEELGSDEFLTSETAKAYNKRLLTQGSPCRWVPWAEQGSEAA